MVTKIDETPVTPQHQPKAPNCSCPACLGLECMERPRYFAGQLLTEVELNSEQAYLLAKNRLHNRYLHGWGVVCGLQVVCHSCDGWVKIKQGYAIDPCGNDIIVCADQDFNVIRYINECKEKQRTRDDCDPWRPTPDPNCDDLEEHWCITLSYQENEARPITALHQSKSASCGCGCGSSNSSKCGCGCHSSSQDASRKQSGSNAQSGIGKSIAACQPTRIFENYRLGVIQQPEECGDWHKSEDATLSQRYGAAQTALMNMVPNSAQDILSLLMKIAPDSLLVKIVNCLSSIGDLFAKRLTTKDLQQLGPILARCLRQDVTRTNAAHADSESHPQGASTETVPGGTGNSAAAAPDDVKGFGEDDVFAYQDTSSGIDVPALHDACCRFRKAILDLYAQNPMKVRCAGPDCPPCPPLPTANQSPQQFEQEVEESVCCLLRQLIDYIADCVCMALLPPCPPNPYDDRLILACVTIKNDKIIDICNFSCRHYAGSFPAVNYWLSLVPIIPLIRYGLQIFCCAPDALDILRGAWRSKPTQSVYNRYKSSSQKTSFAGKSESGFSVANFMASFGGMKAASEKSTEAPPDLESLRQEMASMREELDALKQKS
jgi:hypothetical protein